MANYSTDDDLLTIRPKILSYGVSDWTDHHDRAKIIIDRILEQRWYRPEATHRGLTYEDTPFDSDLLDADQLKYLSCYKTLELIYAALMKPGPQPDGFERQMLVFKDEFDKELQSLLTLGITYDWDEDEEYAEDERITTVRRRLKRT
jgi:hypothetical protein